MRLRLTTFVAIFACGAASAARAEVSMTSSTAPSLEGMSYGSPVPSTKGLPSGLKLGEDSLLHVGLLGEVGLDNNVFFNNDNRKAAAVLRITPSLDLTNAERDGSVPTAVYYDLSAALTYRDYLTGGDSIKAVQTAWYPVGGLSLELSPKQVVSVTILDQFARTEDPPYVEGQPLIVRNRNTAMVQLKVAPTGNRFQLVGRYANYLDLYEDQLKRGDNMGNEFVVDVSWRWLPRTALFVQVAQGFITYLRDDATAPRSYPLKAMAGLRGLLTEKLALNLGVGYTNGFYNGDTSTSGFGNLTLGAELLYAMSLTSRMGLGYRHDFVNSPQIGAFYNLNAVYAAWYLILAGRLSFSAYGRFENRDYQGGIFTDRVDRIITAGAALDLFVMRWGFVGARYSFNFDHTNNTDPFTGGGVDYNKHVVLGRIGVVY